MKDKSINSWDRKLWAIEFSDPLTPPMIIGGSWHPLNKVQYDGQPTQPVLFRTRAKAKKWCKEQKEKYDSYPAGDVVKRWRFRPIRVRETVSAI